MEILTQKNSDDCEILIRKFCQLIYIGDIIWKKLRGDRTMLALKTADEMYKYCIKNKLGTGNTKGWAIKHFQLLIDNLKSDENVYCVFIGLHNYRSLSKHDNNYAYAVTNKRIIMAQHKLLGANVQSVNIQNINDITLSKIGIAGIGIGTICIDTYKEIFNVGVNVSFASNVYNCVHDALDEISKKVNSSVVVKSPIEQVKELNELLDMGIITQNEFDTKRNNY
jgi:hypothetical protein